MWMYSEQNEQTNLTVFYTPNGKRADLSRLGSNCHYPSSWEKALGGYQNTLQKQILGAFHQTSAPKGYFFMVI
jgi:hypothetical protein